MSQNLVLNITFISTNVRKKRNKRKKTTAGCMQDKNVKLPFMYQPPVPNITKFANLGFIQKKFIISLEKNLEHTFYRKGKNRISERTKQNSKIRK